MADSVALEENLIGEMTTLAATRAERSLRARSNPHARRRGSGGARESGDGSTATQSHRTPSLINGANVHSGAFAGFMALSIYFAQSRFSGWARTGLDERALSPLTRAAE